VKDRSDEYSNYKDNMDSLEQLIEKLSIDTEEKSVLMNVFMYPLL
jgi:hypothetical protein